MLRRTVGQIGIDVKGESDVLPFREKGRGKFDLILFPIYPTTHRFIPENSNRD
jgi:hypothetical protein